MVWSATSVSVWQYIHLSEQICRWDTLACCLDVKQATTKQNPSFVDVPMRFVCLLFLCSGPCTSCLKILFFFFFVPEMVESSVQGNLIPKVRLSTPQMLISVGFFNIFSVLTHLASHIHSRTRFHSFELCVQEVDVLKLSAENVIIL